MTKSKTHLQGRNANNGKFTSVQKAKTQKSTHVVERVPNPGYGDTNRGKSKSK